MKLNCINCNKEVDVMSIPGKSHWNDIGVFNGICVSCGAEHRYDCPEQTEAGIKSMCCPVCGFHKVEIEAFQSACNAEGKFSCKILLDSQSDSGKELIKELSFFQLPFVASTLPFHW